MIARRDRCSAPDEEPVGVDAGLGWGYLAAMPITPHIVVQGAERAVTFYRDAFGAEEIDRIPTPDGRLMSVQLRLGDGLLHVADEFPEMGVLAPPSVGGTPVVLSLEVADADAVFAQAVAAGASEFAEASGHPAVYMSPANWANDVLGGAALIVAKSTLFELF